MQKTFLTNVVQAVKTYNLPDTLVIFPTRRACSAFRDELATDLQKASWLPTILPIRDLLLQLSPLPVADDNTLLMELFKVYEKLYPSDNLEIFLTWGQQLIDDFNEIDRQMVSAEQLFQKVIDVKSIENIFALEEVDFAHFKEFWSQFSSENITPLRHEFLSYWEMLPNLYINYKKHLLELQISYEGMSWAFAALTINNNTYFDNFSKVVFAGFYAFTKSEETIIKYLESIGKVVLFKDADNWYIEEKYREAGRFFRKGILSKAEIPWTESLLSTTSKEIFVSGIGGRAAMARELAISVYEKLNDKSEDVLKRSVVVLPDDSLLFPFLDHCSRLGLATNPSMGFPLTHHPLMQLLHNIKSIRKQLTEHQGDWFIVEQSKWMLEHPLLKTMLLEQDRLQLESLSKNIFIDTINSPFSALLLKIPTTVIEEEKIISEFLNALDSSKLSGIEGLRESVQKESKLVWIQLKPYYNKLSIVSWWKLYLGVIDKIRIPFRSEQNVGVQVMGFLETRILDYEYVFIASMNEGTLPGNSTPKSLIPYSLRKAYQLPCREEQDAVTAYHFYRLLQRAGHIHFFYNSDMNDMGGGERSRFLFQLHHELKESNSKINFNYLQIENNLISNPSNEIVIEKSDAIITILKNKFVENFAEKEFSGLSASSINEYIACSLRFYFNQIAGLKEQEIHDTIDPSVFGNIFHEAIHKIYEHNEILTSEIIESKLTILKEFLTNAIHEKFKSTPLSGNDFLMQGVLYDLLYRVLQTDLEELPLKLIGLEKRIQKSIQIENVGNVLIKGIIDRIDEKDNYIRILDYKTGNDKLNLPEDISKLFIDPAFKTSLQLLFYVHLSKDIIQDKSVKAGLFKLKKIKEGVDYLTKKIPIETEIIASFENNLSKLISEIFNPSIPFKQTEDYDQCQYCSYNGICNRLG